MAVSYDPVFGDLDCNDNTPVMQPVSKQSSVSLLSPVHCLSTSPPPWIFDATSDVSPHDLSLHDLSPRSHSPSHADSMSMDVQHSADDFFYDDEFAMQYDAAAAETQSDESAGLWLTASLICVGNSADTWWSVPERLAASDGCLISLRQSGGSLEASDNYSDDTSELCDDEPLFTSPSAIDSQSSSLLTEGLTNSESEDNEEKYRLHTHQYTLAFDPGGGKCSSADDSFQEPVEAEGASKSWVAGSTGSKLEHSVLVRANSDAPLTTWVQLTEQREPPPRMTSWQAMVADQPGSGDGVRSKSLPTLEKRKECETQRRPASCGDDNPACSLFEIFRRSRTEKEAVVSPGALRRLTGTWSMSASSDGYGSPHREYPHVCECAVQTSLQAADFSGMPPPTAVVDKAMQTSTSLQAESVTTSEILNMLPSSEDLQNSLRQCRDMLPPEVSTDSRSSLKSSLLSQWNMFSGTNLPDLSFLNTHMTSSNTDPPQTTPNDTTHHTNYVKDAIRESPVNRTRTTETTNSCCSSSSSGIDAGSYSEHTCSAAPWCAAREAGCGHCNGMVASHPCCNKRSTKPAESRRMDCLHVSPTHAPHDGRALCLWVQHKHPTVCISVGEIGGRPLKPCLVRRRRTGQKTNSAFKHRSWSHPQDAAVMKYSNEGQTQYQLLTPRQCTSLPPEALQCAAEPSQKVPGSIPLPVCPCHSACAVFNSSSESEDGAVTAAVKTKKSVSFAEKVCYASPCSSPQCSPRHVAQSTPRDVQHNRRDVKHGRHKPVSDLQISDMSEPSHDPTSSPEDEPPESFLVSPPSGKQQTLQSDDLLLPDWKLKKDLLLQVTLAAELLQDYFKKNTDSTSHPSSSLAHEVGQLVLRHMCPALHAVVLDGLRPRVRSLFGMVKNSVWSLVEDSAKLGPSTRIFHELVTDLKSVTFLDTVSLKFNAFIFGLLNYHALDFWLICIQSNDSLVTKHYHPHACLSLVSKALPLRHAYIDMTTSLQPLTRLPLRLPYDLEYKSLQTRGARHMAEYLVQKHVNGCSPPVPVAPAEGWVGRLYRLGGKVMGQNTSAEVGWSSIVLPKSRSLLDDDSDSDAASKDKLMSESLPVYKKGVTEYVFDTERAPIDETRRENSQQIFADDKSKQSMNGGTAVPRSASADGENGEGGCTQEETVARDEAVSAGSNQQQEQVSDHEIVCTEDNEVDGQESVDTVPTNQPAVFNDNITNQQTDTLVNQKIAEMKGTLTNHAIISSDQQAMSERSATRQQSTASDHLFAVTSSAKRYWKASWKKKLNRFGLSLIDTFDRMLLPADTQRPQGTTDERQVPDNGDVSGHGEESQNERVNDLDSKHSEEEKSKEVVNSGTAVSENTNRLVRALCYYVDGDQKHLSFERGNIMAVVREVDADWLLCRHGDSEGFVHSACVEPIS